MAAHQPVGLAGLARMIDADKNAIQRALVTLHEAGWIEPATGAAKGWELTSRIFTVAGWSQGRNDLRSRAKAELDALRETSGETSLLTVPDNQHFVVADVVESRQILRTAPAVGTITLPDRSATGFAILPYLPTESQIAMLGQPPDGALLKRLQRTLRDGYAVAVDTPVQGITVVAAPVFDSDSLPVAAICIVAPNDRATRGKLAEFAELVVNAAKRLSRGAPQDRL